MNTPTSRQDAIVLPALLRHARTTYGVAMRRALDAAGYDDIPGNGLYVIGGLAMNANPLALTQLVRELRVSRQAASQLVDTLVSRGYLQRTTDPDDRRKLTVTLTERGQDAARVQTTAREKVDARLLESVGAEAIQSTRRTLVALIDQLCEHDA
ncbi:MarR family winged helix-turn-helix transcriptional regulator [Oleiagrimonas soli]|uniref:DNA-binding MarR family transcriptional regulator n=1 Tax=Oleiagrimonas soli TaxID=1543381 RepID=A0A841KMD1_9GAMM|nr:MarR family transcriptional regulator [Oleiagrimonas soli]MBB6183134.1 DNA-binding MarR family transcriptional regulator [Oleiagrimonas soli]